MHIGFNKSPASVCLSTGAKYNLCDWTVVTVELQRPRSNCWSIFWYPSLPALACPRWHSLIQGAWAESQREFSTCLPVLSVLWSGAWVWGGAGPLGIWSRTPELFGNHSLTSRPNGISLLLPKRDAGMDEYLGRLVTGRNLALLSPCLVKLMCIP